MSEEVRIYIYDGFPLLLPVNPEEIKISSASNPEIHEVINLGQVSELTLPELATFSFESFWPDNQNYHYIQDKYSYYAREEFLTRVNRARNNRKPVKFAVLNRDIDIECVISEFEYGYVGASRDIEYSISFTEYRKAQAKFLQQVDTNVFTEQPARPPSAQNEEITIGATVIVNGQLHRDSQGNGPGATENNETRKISHINKGSSHPYHVVTLDGGWRGWVTEGSVKLA